MGKSIYDECLEVYENSGQGAVLDFVLANYPDTRWEYCDPCEIESPTEDGDCLVCGSVIREVRI